MKKTVFIIIIILFFITTASAEIIFQDDFDDHDDWEVEYQAASATWPTAQTSDFPSDNPTTGARMIGYDGQISVITGQTNPRMQITSSAAKGESGKGLRMQCEAIYGDDDTHSVWYSSNQIYYTLTSTPGDTGYSEIWIQMYRRYQTDFYSKTSGAKYMHVSHFFGNDLNDWHYDSASDVDHAPLMVLYTRTYDDNESCCGDQPNYDDLSQDFEPELKTLIATHPYSTRLDYDIDLPLDCGSYFSDSQSTLYFNPTYEGDTQSGSWQDEGNFGDDNWHYHEVHLKMNSSAGTADGEYAYYIDGICQWKMSDITFVKSGETMVGWNMVSPGGNQDFHTSVPGGETYYYDIDDFTVSTHRLSSADNSTSSGGAGSTHTGSAGSRVIGN